jgi:NitT/TauT family transport system ATP-binding protein
MLSIKDLSYKYGKNTVIDALSYEFECGKVTAIVGESGVGKTTLVNLISSLLPAPLGTIESDINKIGYVFQEPRLFNWMSALENVSTVSDEETARALLTQMGLADALSKYPAELSGGMKQRLSLARALAYGGDLFLLDEPFSALDPNLKTRIAPLIKEATKHALVILVTHDLEDAQLLDATVLECNGAPLFLLKA